MRVLGSGIGKPILLVLAASLAAALSVPLSAWASDTQEQDVSVAPVYVKSSGSVSELEGGESAPSGIGEDAPGLFDSSLAQSVVAPFASASGQARVVQLDVSERFAVMSDGFIWSWGDNGVPSRLHPDVLKGVSSVDTTVHYYYALKQDGSLLFWDKRADSTPQKCLTDVASLVSWYWGMSAIKKDGSLWDVMHGDCRRVLDDVVSFQANQERGNSYNYSYFAIKADGSLWTWGSNTYGQLGLGDTKNRATPQKVMSGVRSIGVPRAGSYTCYAVKTDGSLWGWGDYDSRFDAAAGTSPKLYMTDVASVQYPYAIKTDGSCWALPQGNRQGPDTPQNLRWPEEPRMVMQGIASVRDGLAIKTDGSLWAIGEYDAATDSFREPRKIMSGVAFACSDDVLSTGGESGYAIKTDGTLWAWGDNTYGQLGLGDIKDRAVPQKVMTNVESVHPTEGACFVIKTDGSLWSWGNNQGGQLGVGDAVPDATTTEALYGGSAGESPLFTSPRKVLPLSESANGNQPTVSPATPPSPSKPTATSDSASSVKPAPSAPSTRPSSTPWKRLAGETAYGTMQKVVQEGWSKADTVIVATFDGYWDALSASALAGKSQAPILLTGKDVLDASCASEITRLGAKKAVIVGGPAAVSDKVAGRINGMGLAVKRIAGENAQDTAVAVSFQVGAASGTCIIATSNGHWDALAASPLAYAKRYPIYLTDATGVLSAETLSAIKAAGFKRAIIAGGAVAVDKRTERDLKGIGVVQVVRQWGGTAVQTSRALAEFAIGEGLSANYMGVATLGGYWDALTGGAMLGKKGGVLVLASAENTSNASLSAAHSGAIKRAYILGGEAVLPASVLSAFDAATKPRATNRLSA